MMHCTICASPKAESTKPGGKREDIFCYNCSARRRDQDQAQVILGLISDGTAASLNAVVDSALRTGRDLRILEVALSGPFIAVFEKLPGYIQGYRWLEGSNKSQQQAVQYCDLEKIPFADNSFDLVLTSEVLPFVEQENLAHQEIWRVLKPGGAHVASFPMDWPAPAATEEFYMQDSEAETLSPRLFKTPDGLSLPLRRKYGMDLVARLKNDGYFATLRRESFLDREGRRNVTLMAVKAGWT